MNRYFSSFMFLTLLAVMSSSVLFAAQIKTANEDEVKARIILNLPLVTSWPDMQNKSELPRLCTFGQSSVSEQLAIMALAHEFKGNIRLSTHQPFAALKQCQIVYIDRQEVIPVAEILHALEPYPVLTIGNTPDFIRSGGMIGFLNTKKKLEVFSEKNVRFEVNLRRIRKAGITLDPLLLELAEKIEE